MAIQEKAMLIYTDAKNNNNKFYELILHEDGTLNLRWGRVDSAGQSKTTSGGKWEFDRTISAKLAKGYVRSNTVSVVASKVETNKIEAVVNWDKKEVTLAEVDVKGAAPVVKSQEPVNKLPSVKPTQSVGVFELSSDVVTEGNSGQQAEPVKVKEEVVQAQAKTEVPVAQVVVAKSWSFEGRDNLKEVVESWGKKSGYKVVYNGENYPVDKEDPRVFGGEFDGEDGPVKQLSVDYGPNSRVKKPLSFIFFLNKLVLVISYPPFVD